MKTTKSLLWAALAFACAMAVNLNRAEAQVPTGQTAAPSAQCAQYVGVPYSTAQACKDGMVPAACAHVCVNVNVNMNCGAAPCLTQPNVTPPTTTPPVKHSMGYRPKQVVCEGGTLAADGKSCVCPTTIPPDDMVAVVKLETAYSRVGSSGTTDWYQGTVTYTCVSRGMLAQELRGRLDKFELAFRKFVNEQANMDAVQNTHIALIWGELNKAKSMASEALVSIETLNVIMRSLDKMYGELQSDVAALRDSKPQFVLGAELWLLDMRQAGVAVAPGLKVGFHSYFPETKVGYYAEGFVGLMYRDGIDPSTGGNGSAYHGGAEGGFMLALTEDKALTGSLGFRIDQVFRTSDPNFLGTMFGGTLGLHYSIPGTYLGVGAKGVVSGGQRVIYFSDDHLAHDSEGPIFGGGFTIDWAADIL